LAGPNLSLKYGNDLRGFRFASDSFFPVGKSQISLIGLGYDVKISVDDSNPAFRKTRVAVKRDTCVSLLW